MDREWRNPRRLSHQQHEELILALDPAIVSDFTARQMGNLELPTPILSRQNSFSSLSRRTSVKSGIGQLKNFNQVSILFLII